MYAYMVIFCPCTKNKWVSNTNETDIRSLRKSASKVSVPSLWTHCHSPLCFENSTGFTRTRISFPSSQSSIEYSEVAELWRSQPSVTCWPTGSIMWLMIPSSDLQTILSGHSSKPREQDLSHCWMNLTKAPANVNTMSYKVKRPKLNQSRLPQLILLIFLDLYHSHFTILKLLNNLSLNLTMLKN